MQLTSHYESPISYSWLNKWIFLNDHIDHIDHIDYRALGWHVFYPNFESFESCIYIYLVPCDVILTGKVSHGLMNHAVKLPPKM